MAEIVVTRLEYENADSYCESCPAQVSVIYYINIGKYNSRQLCGECRSQLVAKLNAAVTQES